MKYAPAAALALLAAVVAAIGGALQGVNGPGSQPGITLSHFAGGIVVCALIAAVIGWLARDREIDAPVPAYVTVTDGNAVIPMIGPYETERAAYGDLPQIRAQFDPDGRYAWTVEIVAADATVVGVANEYFKLA
jgi:CDP-diglyceride synthetase